MGRVLRLNLLGVSAVLTAFLFLFGCSSRGPQRPVLRVVMGLTEEEWSVMKTEVFPKFEQRYACRISAYQVEANDWIRKLEAMERAGRVEVDVFAQDNMRLYPLVAKDLVEDVSQYADLIPDEVPKALRGVGIFNGKLYFFPYRPNVQITFYNAEKFAEYGLNPPRDWDELLSVAKVFKEREGIGKVGLKLWGGSPTATQIYEMVISAGGEPFSFTDEGWRRTFRFLKELYPYLSPDSKRAKWDTTNIYLANGSFYLAQNWPFAIGVLVKTYHKDYIKAYAGWRGPVRPAHVVGGEVLGLPKGGEHRELALKFVKFMLSREVQTILLRRLGWPPVRTDVYAEVEDWQRPYFEAVKTALKDGVFRPNVLFWGEFEKLVNSAVTRILVKGEDVDGVLQECGEKMQEVMREAQTNGDG